MTPDIGMGFARTSSARCRIQSVKYTEWQVMAYAEARDKALYKKEEKLYQQWLATQPSAVPRPEYTYPTSILQHEQNETASDNNQHEDRGDAQRSTMEEDAGIWVANTLVTMRTPDEDSSCSEGSSDDSLKRNFPEATPGPNSGSDFMVLEKSFISVVKAIITKGYEFAEDDVIYVHEPADVELTDYAQELAFLPDFSDHSPTELDFSAANVMNSTLSGDDQPSQVSGCLENSQKHMIASGNALPPPAYGVVCDINVEDHAPIKPRARRIPIRYLQTLYELLKGLLKANLVSFSDSQWASPIVIVLKKNGEDIRLCIDYKMVNSVTAIDDLLTDLDSYLWFCSLDAASGFWAIMMAHRARKVSAFVCPLGHFEWLRMPFGLKTAPTIYQRMIDNALWGFVQPKGGWQCFTDKMKVAEDLVKSKQVHSAEHSNKSWSESPIVNTKFAAARSDVENQDPVLMLVNEPTSDMFAINEVDESALVPVFNRRSFVDDNCFGGKTFDDFLTTLDRLLALFTECRIRISFTKSIFVQPRVEFLSHEVSHEGVRANTKPLAAITKLSFPRTKRGRFIQDFAVFGAALYQLKDDDFEDDGDLTTARRSFDVLKQKVAEAPILRHFDKTKEVHIMLFANEWTLSTTLLQLHEDKLHPVGFCGRVLKDAEMNYHPAEKEVLALLLLLKTCYTQLAGRILHVYTRFSTLEWITKSKSVFGRAVQWAVLLSPWHLIVQRIKE
ncbi:hypothetical protein PHMEG_00020899 [Phytophthora megakarya]|uniref:Reverse transcriptase/retrotransposon-derived protein RNase H-like domain-containing protein n=1 Tax=Phytophthora megakarya TaxID=4795 RepID=A0A225VN89_9STRA|nr:hypothetical protein PHMEG_00020899 [Phytophthora megakarya]